MSYSIKVDLIVDARYWMLVRESRNELFMIDISELDEGALEDILSEPADATKQLIAGLNGDIVVLGAGGKMGPTLAMMLKKASSGKKIYAVS